MTDKSTKETVSAAAKFHSDIKDFFTTSLKLTLKKPSMTPFLTKTFFNQIKAAKIRSKFLEKGTIVPPLMIFSITNKCNLNCAGCYSHAHKRDEKKMMSTEEIEKMMSEAEQIGISIVMIAGGEPFIRQDIHDIVGKHPKIVFPVFTNATLIDEQIAEIISKTKNLIPVLSIEGNETHTDNRRGEGIYDTFRSAISHLNKKKIFWGISITVTRENYSLVTGKAFIENLIELGGNLFFFVEYVPIHEATMNLVLTNEQKSGLAKKVSSLSSEYKALFATLPGDEENYGGCLAAGRGFIHINAGGDIEPCPFAPYSDINVKTMTILEALEKSRLLASIRENHSALTETAGGCALWAHREWVRSLLNKPTEPSPVK